MAETYPHPKMNLPQRLENFWYHYHWQFLFGLVVALFIGIALVQSFLQKDPDASFLYVGPVSLSDKTCSGIISATEDKLTNDYNGDGRIIADIRTVQLSTDLSRLSPHQKNEADKSFQRYVEEILAGDDFFLLLAPEFYERLDQAGALMSVYEIFGEWRGDDAPLSGIPLRETALSRYDGFKDLPGDTMLCLKYAGGISGDLSKDEEEQINQINMKIYQDLCD